MKLDKLKFKKFKEWRSGQYEVVQQIMNSKKRFFAAILPTGSGKSLIYMSIAKMMKGRCVILTSTKALQEQLRDDFGCVVMKGRNEYKCLMTGYSCDNGLCRCGVKCPKESECEYNKAFSAFLSADIAVTNYHFLMSNRVVHRDIGDIDCLVMDEAHDIPDIVCDINCVTIPYDICKYDRKYKLSINDWAFTVMADVSVKYDSLRNEISAVWTCPRCTFHILFFCIFD